MHGCIRNLSTYHAIVVVRHRITRLSLWQDSGSTPRNGRTNTIRVLQTWSAASKAVRQDVHHAPAITQSISSVTAATTWLEAAVPTTVTLVQHVRKDCGTEFGALYFHVGSTLPNSETHAISEDCCKELSRDVRVRVATRLCVADSERGLVQVIDTVYM